MEVREARPGELPTVMSVLDGGLLAVSPADVRAGETLVAAVDGRVHGALVLDGRTVVAVAVRPRSRGRGIGSALVEAAAARRERLVAEFEADRRPFYESLDFAVESGDEPGRLRGVRTR